MEDLQKLLSLTSTLANELEKVRKQHFDELEQLFCGVPVPATEAVETPSKAEASKNASVVTPQQTKKRPKRLSSLVEVETDVANANVMQQSVRVSNAQLVSVAEIEEEQPSDEADTTANLMPPPPAPADTTISSGRPKRAAKIRCEKNLVEPRLNTKMRRPTNEEIKIKLEHEQRPSQFNTSTSNRITTNSEDKAPSTSNEVPEDGNTSKNLRILIKREKKSTAEEVGPASADVSSKSLKATKTAETLVEKTSKAQASSKSTMSECNDNSIVPISNAANKTSNPVSTKKDRKKKEVHKPIKVERFSDLEKNSPIASRTRKGSAGKRNSQESQPPQNSIYEDAVENGLHPASDARAEPAVNATMTLEKQTIDGTFIVAPQTNATITVSQKNASDATFAVDATSTDDKDSSRWSDKSMVTAPDSSLPQPQDIMTEDESQDVETPPMPSSVVKSAVPLSAKAMKMPTRTHELFNPLMESPVKMRVEAFENAYNTRLKRPKNAMGTPNSSKTPVVGKLAAPTLGRFLTPTQSTTITPINSAQPKKAPMSASKATSLLKTATGTNLKSTASTSSKTLSRENSGEDFRKGLHQLAEERKKQREQKHIQAAQLREAKERERAERMAKLAKERDEKRLRKMQEQERKKQELEELQRKQRMMEEIEAQKKAKAKEEERQLLKQMKQQQMSSSKANQVLMPPPQPKSMYTFDMLHEDDSTDDEGKVSYKRPPVPSWSRSHERNTAIVMQSACPTDFIDSFFSVAPTTPDLQSIFPSIDPRYLKRNSSVLWNTPPRYSELPKY